MPVVARHSHCVSISNEILMYFRGKKKSAQDVYISDPIDTDKEGHSLTLMDIMAEDDDMLESVDLRINSEKLHDFINTLLEEREKQIISMRYGILGFTPHTQREVAKKMQISRSYVSRIEKRALEKLRLAFGRRY